VFTGHVKEIAEEFNATKNNKPVNQYEHCPDVIVLHFITYFLCQQWSEDNQKSIDGQNISKNPLNDDAIYLRIKTMIFISIKLPES
jgi:hypothetical protein